jgi:hypothetical protein
MTIEEQLNSYDQRDIGGYHLWIKPNGDTLTISRSCIPECEGHWTEEEIEVAEELYEQTEAARR